MCGLRLLSFIAYEVYSTVELMKTVCIALPKDIKDAGMPDAHLCTMAYNKARAVGAEQIRIHDPSGWSRVFTLSDVENYLRKNPSELPLLNFRPPQPDEPQNSFIRNSNFQLTRGGLFTPAA